MAAGERPPERFGACCAGGLVFAARMAGTERVPFGGGLPGVRCAKGAKRIPAVWFAWCSLCERLALSGFRPPGAKEFQQLRCRRAC